MTPPPIIQRDREAAARELLAAEMKREWAEIYRDRDTGELPSEESWLERAQNAPASLRAIIAALETADQVRLETIEEAAKVCDEVAGENDDREASALIGAENATDTSGRDVEMEYAVGYSKQARSARHIATRIRSLATQTERGEI